MCLQHRGFPGALDALHLLADDVPEDERPGHRPLMLVGRHVVVFSGLQLRVEGRESEIERAPESRG